MRTSIAQKESAFNTAFRGQPKKVSYSLKGAKVQEIKSELQARKTVNEKVKIKK